MYMRIMGYRQFNILYCNSIINWQFEREQIPRRAYWIDIGKKLITSEPCYRFLIFSNLNNCFTNFNAKIMNS